MHQVKLTEKLLAKHGSSAHMAVFPKSQGVHDPKISRMADGARYDTNQSNASRNLAKFIFSSNKALNVPVSAVQTPLKSRAFSRSRQIEVEPWPVFHLSDWLKVSFADPYRGFYWLGGFRLEDLDFAGQLLTNFWQKYRYVDPSMTLPEVPSRTLPLCIHGDEGRGQCKRPIMVISFQPLLGWTGNETVNSKGCFVSKSFCFAFGLTLQCCVIRLHAFFRDTPTPPACSTRSFPASDTLQKVPVCNGFCRPW